MKVHPSHTGEVGAARTAHAAKTHARTGGASFAGMLARQGTATTAAGTDVTTTAPTAGAAAPIRLREGETTTQVEGRGYAEIHGGKRDGMYVNLTDNSRRGQAFTLVFKHGREYHIYGTGADRLVVALRKRDPDDVKASTGGASLPTVSAS